MNANKQGSQTIKSQNQSLIPYLTSPASKQSKSSLHRVREIVEEGVQEVVDLLKEFDQINAAFAEPDADYDKLLARQGEVQEKLDQLDVVLSP